MQPLPALPSFYRLVALSRIDSTSDEAKRLAAGGAAEGTLVWAREQSSGHGRLGRTWISPPGNLYVSLLLRPQCQPAEATQLTFVAAVALAETVADALAGPGLRQVTCKWPNDVLVGGRKIAGILLESGLDQRGRIDFLVIGVGVNIATSPPDADVHYPATALHAEGAAADVTVERMIERLCTRFQVHYQDWQDLGFPPVRAAWLARADRLGQQIEVREGADPARGIFAGLDDAGALLLQQGPIRRTILAGDVFPIA